jgi:hypothetical protein
MATIIVNFRTFHPNFNKENAMSEEDKHEKEPISKWQKVFDNIWLLFVLSLLISTVLYNAWGIYDLLNVPLAP